MNEKILDLISQGQYTKVKNELTKYNEADIAHLLREVDDKNLLILFRLLPKDLAVEVFAHLDTDDQKHIIESTSDEEVIAIVDELFLDDTVDLLEEMPANIVKKILKNTDQKTRNLINQYLKYPEDSAGSLMTIEYADLKKDMTVKEALTYIRANGVDKETINICYVIDQERILEGVVSLRTLILADENAKIQDLMEKIVISIHTHSDQEEVARLFQKYDYYVMPVVDGENRLVGIITVDDILDVIQQEATEDMQRMAATTPDERPYLKTSNWILAKNRLPWLLFLMVSATFTGGIIDHYEGALQSVLILATFIPMIMDTGGNSGSQSSALIIRGIALDEIKPRDFKRVVGKELVISSMAGLILSLTNFAKLMLINKVDLEIGLTVSITLFLTVVLSKVVGSVLPLIAKKMKLDPALMAGPLITTIVDAFALIIYFNIATLLLGL